MHYRQILIVSLLSSILAVSCVSSKKFRTERERLIFQNGENERLRTELTKCSDEKLALTLDKSSLEKSINDLEEKVAYLRENHTTTLKQLEDLSVISSTQAESIKKSLQNIDAKDAHILDLHSAIARKDSLNMALVLNLKGAIGNMYDDDINVKVEKGVVYIDISDKLLFRTGSYEITDKAKSVLAKVAKVLNNQPDLEFMVEGHTDNVPFRKGILQDNWDLSVKRATSIVRVLQQKYGLSPTRMVAAGRGEYIPMASNSSAKERAVNRRTRIVVLPQLDQFFKLLEPKA